MQVPFCGSKFPLLKILLFSFVLTCFGGEAQGQAPGDDPSEEPGGGGPPPPPPPGTDPTAVPIDGGAGWLLAAGAGYGIKKLRERRKKNSEAQNSESENMPQPQVL
jgi:hypothetical protein